MGNAWAPVAIALGYGGVREIVYRGPEPTLPAPKWLVRSARYGCANELVGMAYDTPEAALEACADALGYCVPTRDGRVPAMAVRYGDDGCIEVFASVKDYVMGNIKRCYSPTPTVSIGRIGIKSTARTPGQPSCTGYRLTLLDPERGLRDVGGADQIPAPDPNNALILGSG